MNSSQKKNSILKRIYLSGAFCAGMLLALPAMAQISPNFSSSNVSQENLLAQTTQDTPKPESNPEAEGSPPATAPDNSSPSGSGTSSPSGSGTSAPENSGGARTTPGTNASTQGSNYEKGTWICLNNPNPGCGNSSR